MSVQNSFTGSEYLTPEVAIGFGIAIPTPSVFLASLVTNQLYYQESNDNDVVFVSAEGFLISFFKSYTSQKLLQLFTIRMTNVSGDNKLRFIHRNMATCFTFQEALRAVGIPTNISDDYSGSMVAMNTELAQYWILVYKA